MKLFRINYLFVFLAVVSIFITSCNSDEDSSSTADEAIQLELEQKKAQLFSELKANFSESGLTNEEIIEMIKNGRLSELENYTSDKVDLLATEFTSLIKKRYPGLDKSDYQPGVFDVSHLTNEEIAFTFRKILPNDGSLESRNGLECSQPEFGICTARCLSNFLFCEFASGGTGTLFCSFAFMACEGLCVAQYCWYTGGSEPDCPTCPRETGSGG